MAIAGSYVRTPVTQIVEGDVLAARPDKPKVTKVDVFTNKVIVFTDNEAKPVVTYDADKTTFVTR